MLPINQLKNRVQQNGGISPTDKIDYRVDATCWAILAFSKSPDDFDWVTRARNIVASDQLPDGSISLSQKHPEVIWPTSLAILAWHLSPDHMEHIDKAVYFLITNSGTHWQNESGSLTSHDTFLKGWPWIAGTHSWVEPTALAMMALKSAGYGEHDRVKEGARLLLDRQLPSGGWNYGNTNVFGQILRPMPLSTGMALNALKDHTSFETVEHSITYLQQRVKELRTPRSLAWSLLGLGAWNAKEESLNSMIDICLKNQERYGAYDTESLSLLMIAKKSPAGLEGIFNSL